MTKTAKTEEVQPDNHSGLKVDNKKVQGVFLKESPELTKAVKADAQARQKEFNICRQTGVLIVG